MSAIPHLGNISNISRLWSWGGWGLVPQWPYILQIWQGGAFNPVDATTYYFGNGLTSSTVDATDLRMYVPKRWVLKKCYVGVRNWGTAGTTETSSFYISVTSWGTTTDYLISSAVTTNNPNQVFSSTSLNIQLLEWDYICGKWVAPTYVTNPTAVIFSISMWIEPTPSLLGWSKVVLTWWAVSLTAVSSTDMFVGEWVNGSTDIARIYIPYTWTITYWIANIRNWTNWTPAAWTAQFFLDANAWTYESIGTTTMGVTNVDLNSTLTTAVTAWQSLCIRMTNPAWTVAPVFAINFSFELTIS